MLEMYYVTFLIILVIMQIYNPIRFFYTLMIAYLVKRLRFFLSFQSRMSAENFFRVLKSSMIFLQTVIWELLYIRLSHSLDK